MKCPNPNCAARPKENARFCAACGTPFLQSVNQSAASGHVGGVGYVDGNVTGADNRVYIRVGDQLRPVVECPECGANRDITETFNCKGACDRKYICEQHWDSELMMCSQCASEFRWRRLRREPKYLHDIEAMVKRQGFFHARYNEEGVFRNEFHDNGDGTVTDRATRLMWQKGESDVKLNFYDAINHIGILNRRRFTGYSDWRLPTLEELFSLMESRKPGKRLHFGTVFDSKDLKNCSADLYSKNKKWCVWYDVGESYHGDLSHEYYVRAVRSFINDAEEFPSRNTEGPLRGMRFVWISSGMFMMGSPEHEVGRREGETIHPVYLSTGFYLQTTPVTQGQWKELMRNNPSEFIDGGDDCPVERVSWDDVQSFIKRLNAQQESGWFRLPTEAEWEYACRSGSSGRFCFGDDEERLDGYAWYETNSGDKTHPVGSKRSNPRGLYDMHGIVWEWCEDPYSEDAYAKHHLDNPMHNGSSTHRVLRGGSYGCGSRSIRCANRAGNKPGKRHNNVGFRLLWSDRKRTMMTEY